MATFPALVNWNQAPILDSAAAVKILAAQNSNNGLFRYVRRGTVLGITTVGGKARPCAVLDVSSADAAAVSLSLLADDIPNFYTGDIVTFSNSAGFATPVVLTVGAGGATVSIAPRVNDGLAHSFEVVSAGTINKYSAVFDAAGVITAVVTIGSVSNTVADFLVTINEGVLGQKFVATLATGVDTEVIAAAAAAPLTNVVAPNGVVTTRTITKTGVVLSWTGAVDMNQVNYMEVRDGSQEAVGVCQEDLALVTNSLIDGDIAQDTPCTVGLAGVVMNYNVLIGAKSALVRTRLNAKTLIRVVS